MAHRSPSSHLLAELRRLAPERHRKISRGGDVVPMLTRLIGECRMLAIEERAGGIAFRLAGQGDHDADPAFVITCVLHHPRDAALLTVAETAVAEQLCEGRTLAQIAHLRGVSPNTVKSQVRQVFRKLNVDSRVALVRRLCP
jgi:DNA-binding CsgD family transcriptional regulator